jgi:hypothetical protein
MHTHLILLDFITRTILPPPNIVVLIFSVCFPCRSILMVVAAFYFQLLEHHPQWLAGLFEVSNGLVGPVH